MNTKNETPRVWIGCLAAYNAGTLYGEWIDATMDAEDIDQAIADVLKSSPVTNAEEADIFDTDEMFGLTPASCLGEDIARIGKFIEEHGEIGAEMVKYYGGMQHLDEAIEALTDRFYGVYEGTSEDALEQLAREFAEDAINELPEHLQGYFDFRRYGMDLVLSGDFFTIKTNEGTAIFSSR